MIITGTISQQLMGRSLHWLLLCYDSWVNEMSKREREKSIVHYWLAMGGGENRQGHYWRLLLLVPVGRLWRRKSVEGEKRRRDVG